MKNVIILMIFMILTVIGLFSGCGRSVNSSLTGILREDPNLDFYSISYTVVYDEEVQTLPADITENNFVAYYAYSGSSSVEKIYLIRNEDGILKAYARSFNSGKAKTYSSESIANEMFFNSLSKLSVNSEGVDSTDGGENKYAYNYYNENGKTYRCMTENILEDK